VEVELQPLSVLFGPNAAGKSNFLDALQILSRVATSRTLKEAFEPPYRGTPLESFSFGEGGLVELLSRDAATFVIEVDVCLSPGTVRAVDQQIREMRRGKSLDEESTATTDPDKQSYVRERYLRYRIEVEILPKSGILRVADEYLAALNTRGEPSGQRRPFLERMGHRIHLRMEGQAHPTYFERYLDHSILSRPLYAPHHPHLVAMQQELSSWLFYYFEPRERMRAPNPVKEVRHIGLMGEELAAFLNTLHALDQTQFQAIEKAIGMIIPTVTGIDVEVNRLGEVELKVFEGNTPVPARVLSEGTLRVLGLLALVGAKEPPALVGFEEPENGVHPRRIRLIAEFLKTRAALGETQIIATTHSPVLLNLLPTRYLFHCRKLGRETVLEPFPTLDGLWRQDDIELALDDEEALTVSERILRGDLDA
jgi:predicted ATPase